MQQVGELLQTTSADPVGPLLIFLDLLKRDSNRVTKSGLAHFPHHALQADPPADMDVNRVWAFRGHRGRFCFVPCLCGTLLTRIAAEAIY